MSISQLPVDIFIYELTFLPFDQVIGICSSDRKFHHYCSDPRYSDRWKRLVENTFGNIYNYSEKLQKIQDKLIKEGKLVQNQYNYLVYTQFVNLLDPVTQLMIYHKQKDRTRFNDVRFNNFQRVLALFLLNEREELNTYEDIHGAPKYIDYDPETTSQQDKNEIVRDMATNGNMLGLLWIVSDGGDLYFNSKNVFVVTAANGHLDILKYYIDNKIIEKIPWSAFTRAEEEGHLDVVKYLLSLNPFLLHAREDIALRDAAANNYPEMLKFLISKGADVHAMNDEALIEASSQGNLQIVQILVEAGAKVHAVNDMALRRASKYGHLDVVQYLVSKGANIYAQQDDALKLAVKHRHLSVENYLRSIYENDNEENYQELEEYTEYEKKYQPEDYWSE